MEQTREEKERAEAIKQEVIATRPKPEPKKADPYHERAMKYNRGEES